MRKHPICRKCGGDIFTTHCVAPQNQTKGEWSCHFGVSHEVGCPHEQTKGECPEKPNQFNGNTYCPKHNRIENTPSKPVEEERPKRSNLCICSECLHAHSDKVPSCEAFISRSELEGIKEKNFEFMEPCEPDCDEVRHARHEGSWKHYIKMENYLEQLIKEQ